MFRYDLLKSTKRLVDLLNGDEERNFTLAQRVHESRQRAEIVHDIIARERVEEDCEMNGDLRNIHNVMTDAQFRRGEPVYHSPFHRPKATDDADSLIPQPATP